MDFGRLIRRSFQVAWQHKSLWVLGLFASGGASNLNLDIDLEEFQDISPFGWEVLDIPAEVYIPLIIGGLILALVLFILNLICEAGLIDSVNKIERGGIYHFGGAFSAGIDFFLRFLGLVLLTIFASIVSVGAIALLGVLFFIGNVILGIISLLILLPSAILVIFCILNIVALTQRAMVVRNVSIGDALEEAYVLFRENLSRVFIISLVYVGLTIAFGIASAIIWFAAGAPIAAIVMALQLGLGPALLAGLIFGLPVSIVVGGILGTFFSSLYTLFYFELVEPGRPAVEPAAATAGPVA